MIDDERGTSPDDLDFEALVDVRTPKPCAHAWAIREDDGVFECVKCFTESGDDDDAFAEILAELRGADEVTRAEVTRAPSAPTIPHWSYLGASDLGAILGFDPSRTSLDTWSEKTRRVPPRASTPEIDAGNDHEAAVVAGARRRLLREGVADRVDHPGPGTILGTFEPGGVERLATWRGATLDATVHHREHGPCPLEAKLVGGGMADAWGPEPAGAEGIPLRTLVQVHWQALHAREIFGWACPVAFVAADIAGTDRRLYVVPIDDAMIAELLEAGREWWRAHVLGDVMPEPTGRDVETLGQIFPHVERPGLSPFVPSGLRELAEDYVVAREIALRHRAELARIGAQIRAMVGDGEGYRWPTGRVTWRESGDGRRLNVRVWEGRE